jgi:UDP-3-O-[3-hydroxymyristoyl] N-acetylglucosamine deacetylase
MESSSDINQSEVWQRTLGNWVRVQGLGLHSGKRVELSLGPAAADSGVVFVRSDLPGSPQICARPRGVADSMLCTILEENGVRVSTVEHLLAALAGLGVDNATVMVNAEELPVLDGSALPFVRLIQQAGVRLLGSCRTWLRVVKPVSVSEGDRSVQLLPARRLSVDCTVDFDHPLVIDQKMRYLHEPQTFEQEVAPARTFGFLKDVGEMRRRGLAQGGSLDNAVVVDSFSVLNPGGLRFQDEFVRHKILDLIGDLALLGAPLAARVVAHKSGHRLHHRLVQALLDQPGAVEWVQLSEGRVQEELPVDFSSLRVPGLQRV